MLLYIGYFMRFVWDLDEHLLWIKPGKRIWCSNWRILCKNRLSPLFFEMHVFIFFNKEKFYQHFSAITGYVRSLDILKSYKWRYLTYSKRYNNRLSLHFCFVYLQIYSYYKSRKCCIALCCVVKYNYDT